MFRCVHCNANRFEVDFARRENRPAPCGDGCAQEVEVFWSVRWAMAQAGHVRVEDVFNAPVRPAPVVYAQDAHPHAEAEAFDFRD